jgi:hypothetical protein
MRQLDTKYCRWEIMLKVWTGHASLSTVPPPPHQIALSSNGPQSHRFAPTTVTSHRLIGIKQDYTQTSQRKHYQRR